MKTILLLALAAVMLSLFVSSCGREAPVGTLEIVSDPAGVRVTVTPLGETTKSTPSELLTPLTLTLGVGSFRVNAELDGYQVTPGESIVAVSPAQLTRVEFGLARLGTVNVISSIPGAAIWIDGEDTGEVTPHVFSLIEGEHEVVLVLAGYVTDSGPQTISIDGDTPADAGFTLLPSGFLTVTSTPAGASISIDGIASDELTPATLELAAGDHTVTAARAGYLVSPESVDVFIAEGETSTADFTLVVEGSVGDLTVTSTPPGAAIMIDGTDSGEITPHTFSLAPLNFSVAVARHGFHAADARTTTVVAAGEVTEDFQLSAAKIVLLETISGVNCAGCPAMNTVLLNLENSGYGPDEMLGIKYSGPFGGPDLHYNANSAVLQARMTFYASNTIWNWAAPTLFFNGDLAVAPAFNNGYPSFGEMTLLLDAALATDPGFAIDVAVVDYAADPVVITIDLVPTREITGTNVVLNVAIVENPIVYDTPPGSYGETEFHWICREYAQVSTSPLPISPAAPGHFEFNLTKQANWTGVETANLWTIVFVQNETTLEVIQAGALVPTAHLQAAATPHLPTLERTRP